MSKTVFMFPGQGSQYIGMGKSLAQGLPAAAAIFKTADDVLGKKISKLCFDGPVEELSQTINTQPAIFTASLAAFYSIKNVEPDFYIGHSLGEVTALVASGVLSLEEGLQLVNERARLMQEEAQQSGGAMAAVLGLNDTQVKKAICGLKDIYIANINCPGQVVISGKKEAVEKSVDNLKENGAKRVVMLAVSGAFHSPFMAEAKKKLARFVEKIDFKDAKKPIVQNTTAEPEQNGKIIKENIIAQLTDSVKFKQSLFFLDYQGVTRYIEVGPGKVLSGLIKKTLKNASIYNIEDIDSLEKTVNNLKL